MAICSVSVPFEIIRMSSKIASALGVHLKWNPLPVGIPPASSLGRRAPSRWIVRPLTKNYEVCSYHDLKAIVDMRTLGP